MDRRVFMAVGGSALTQLVLTVPRLRQLDDRQGGGGANLSYVHAQFQAVAQLLKTADHGGQITRRPLVALAELGQLAGWIAADTERHGLAQRY